MKRSRVGRSWAAIREDEDAAELMGVPTFKMKLWSFAMGAAVGGLAGWIYATKVAFINPATFPFTVSILILAAVVLGGLGSTPGVIAGAFAVGFLPEYLRDAGGEGTLDFLNNVTGGNAGDITEYRVLPLRPRPRADDAVPPAGPPPEPPAGGRAGRVHQRRRRAWAPRSPRRRTSSSTTVRRGPVDASRCPPTWTCRRRR